MDLFSSLLLFDNKGNLYKKESADANKENKEENIETLRMTNLLFLYHSSWVSSAGMKLEADVAKILPIDNYIY